MLFEKLNIVFFLNIEFYNCFYWLEHLTHVHYTCITYIMNAMNIHKKEHFLTLLQNFVCHMRGLPIMRSQQSLFDVGSIFSGVRTCTTFDPPMNIRFYVTPYSCASIFLACLLLWDGWTHRKKNITFGYLLSRRNMSRMCLCNWISSLKKTWILKFFLNGTHLIETFVLSFEI